MSNTHIEDITKNIKDGVMSTVLVKDDNSASFPDKNFSGYCYIRKTLNPFYVAYRLRVNYGRPARLLIKMTSVAIESDAEELNGLWDFVSEIESRKRQR